VHSKHLDCHSAGGFDAIAANITESSGIADNDRIGARVVKNALPEVLWRIGVDDEFAFENAVALGMGGPDGDTLFSNTLWHARCPEAMIQLAMSSSSGRNFSIDSSNKT
jgi:hypothetical protein